jgi:hypothetical protein
MKLSESAQYRDDEGSTLSADAAPFHPYYEPVNLCIYNGGVPSLVFTSEKDRWDILHGIQDQTLDEQFPPDAEEAFELEAAEAFVMEMVHLAILEEREEKARFTLGQFQKRWEVRRAMGPTGRPRPAMHLIEPACHTNKNHRQTKALVTYSHHHGNHNERRRIEAMKTSQRMEPRLTKCVMPPRPIVQPRKHY